jgi:hypothetical protein
MIPPTQDPDHPVSAHVLAEGEAHLGAPLRALRGSYLALLRSFDGLEDGLDPSPLLIHLPGHTEQSLRATPLLELYHAGKRWRKALDTAITEAAAGRVPADELQAFLANKAALTIDGADALLAGLLRGRRDGRTDLASQIEGVGLDALVDDLFGGGLVVIPPL